MKVSQKRLLMVLLLVGLLSVVWLVTRPQQANGQKGGGTGGERGKRPAVVTVSKVKLQSLPITTEAIGNVEALESVSIQPQISGQLKAVHFTQGAYVTRGQLLFELDSRIQAAAVAQAEAMISRSQAGVREARANLARSSTLITAAEANLKRDQAQQKFAAIEVARYRKLLDKSYVALQEVQRLETTLATAEATLIADRAAIANARAQVQADQAALQTALSSVSAEQAALAAAKVQLGFTRIYAPIAGKTGPLLINAGNNVQANNSPMVNIKRLSPIAVTFAVAEKLLPEFQQAMRLRGVPVTASLKDKPGQSLNGRLSFIDNTVNKSNGTVNLKATFDNPAGSLWPGLFVSVTARLGTQAQALTIPAAAIQKGPTGDFVYLMANGKARMQPISVDRISAGTAVVKGLKPNQDVIVTGQLALAPDAPVQLAGKPEKGKGDGKGDGKGEGKGSAGQ